MQDATTSGGADAASIRRTRARPARRRAARGTQHPLTSEVLIGLVAQGDHHALGELYDRFAGFAYGLALRVARDPRLAEDAVHDAFLSVWRSAVRFDAERGAPQAWIATLTHRRAVDLVDRAERRREQPGEVVAEPAGPSTAETAAERSERRRVRTALASLPAAQREALELAYYGGYSQREIAERLSVPLGTVKSRVFSGLRGLRALLADDGDA